MALASKTELVQQSINLNISDDISYINHLKIQFETGKNTRKLLKKNWLKLKRKRKQTTHVSSQLNGGMDMQQGMLPLLLRMPSPTAVLSPPEISRQIKHFQSFVQRKKKQNTQRIAVLKA